MQNVAAKKFLSDAYRQRVEKMLYDMSAERKMPRIVYQMIEANAQPLFDEKMLGEAVIVCQRVYAMIKEGFFYKKLDFKNEKI